MVKKQTTSNILLALLAFGLTAAVIQAAPLNPSPMNAPLPRPEPFDSLLPLPHACPAAVEWSSLTLKVDIVGLPNKHQANLRLLADTAQTTACLALHAVDLPQLSMRNGSDDITIADIPDGSYKLTIDAPTDYFREPAGYVFQVRNGEIIRRPGFTFQFRLNPPSEQELPPCREFEKKFVVPTSDLGRTAEIVSVDTQRDVCWAERTIDISGPSKQPERYLLNK